MKLGQILIDKGIIDKAQLEETLRAQLRIGGHLGTCLIEAGLVDEYALGDVLSESARVPCAAPEMFQDISRYVIQSLPSEVVQKHHAIPILRDGRKLDVAMIDPADLGALDALSFAAGCSVRPWIAPEIRIFQAMERYYDIPRRQRYVALSHRLEHRAPVARKKTPATKPATPDATPSGAHKAPPAVPDKPPRAVKPRDPLNAVSSLLCRKDSVDDLLDTALTHAMATLSRCVFLRVKNGLARVSKTRGFKPKPEALRSPGFPLAAEPIFTLLRGESCYRGPLPPEAAFVGFYDTLGMDIPEEIVLIPLYLDDRLVAFFHGDGGPEKAIQGETREYERLMKKVALAFHVLILKRQILAA